ncbi:MAG: glycoside hydrolase family 3 C-terminal domain-containing protein [Acidimicrobiales bacterium]
MNPTPVKPNRRTRPSTLSRVLLAVVAVVVFVVVVAQVPASTVAGRLADTTGGAATPLGVTGSKCPWLEAAMTRNLRPSTLARMVVGRMTLGEKVGEIVLAPTRSYENANAGVPRLCIPALSLQDGPQGVAFGALRVTQLPAPLGIAATFDPAEAHSYGQVIGTEAAAKGIDVVQGPDLNIDRVPQNGRSWEGFGEDPALVASMGVADIEGIQGAGTMAMAKHFAVYNQETNRGQIDAVVSQRALHEIYLPPFEAAVSQAHVAAVMCAYPRLDGVFECEDAQLLDLLRQWGFAGFVRSDLNAVQDPGAALSAGTDLLKPAVAAQLVALVVHHQLPVTVVDTAVTKVMTEMFAHGLIGRRTTGSASAAADSANHAAFALAAAEHSAVLLKDSGAVLPLSATHVRSVVVIGADAASDPETSGFGSAQVAAPFTSTPLSAIRRRAGGDALVTYANGGSTTSTLAPIPNGILTPSSGGGNGLTLTLVRYGPRGDDLLSPSTTRTVEPTVDTDVVPYDANAQLPPPSPGVSRVVLPQGWSDATARWTGTLTPRRSGVYTLSLQGSGSDRVTIDGRTAVSDLPSHDQGIWSGTVALTAHHRYGIAVDWDPFGTLTPYGLSSPVPGTITLGWSYVSGQIRTAVDAARRADVAVVFAADYESEDFDRPNLSLPGDENQLIAAVAAANPRTVVVLNTGGPVLMPWLSRVAGVIEAWYPGEEDGTAIAALLYGDVDPSGRLPVTFPTVEGGTGVDTAAQWPGVDLHSDYTEGLDIGYRYDHALGIRPQFPFGFGLAYTTFALNGLGIVPSASGVAISVRVTDTGERAGTDVPQAYLTYPESAGEPPAQLVAFRPVTLAPHASTTVSLFVPWTSFRAFIGGTWTTVPGRYLVSVGESSSDLALTAPVIPG